MTRVMLVYTILLLLPFLIFGGWRWIAKGARGHKEVMNDAPILVLLLIGISLVGVGLFFLASKEQTGTSGRYHPPIIKDGKIVPGHFEQSSSLPN